jgi:Domain of unknown function (DUF6371)
MIQLETYKGTRSRHTCPSCGARNSFVRYVDGDGAYIDSTVGRCNRESKCNYHYSPKQYFADNPTTEKLKNKSVSNSKPKTRNYGFVNQVRTEIQKTDYIPFDHLLPMLSGYDQNSFTDFLFALFPEDLETVWMTAKRYFIGTYQHKFGCYTSFPYIDRRKRIERAKLIRFSAETGKRLKGDYDTSSLSAILKKQGKLKENFALGNCFFGEHLLAIDESKPAAIVESEKSALIGAICFPNMLWLACGSKQSLKAERLRRIGTRDIILYPDADGYEVWNKVASDARRLGLSIKVSKLIESSGTAEEKRDGYDLADYLINQQRQINEHNSNADDYNQRLNKVLSDQSLNDYFNDCYTERLALMEIDELPDSEIRQLVISVTKGVRL